MITEWVAFGLVGVGLISLLYGVLNSYAVYVNPRNYGRWKKARFFTGAAMIMLPAGVILGLYANLPDVQSSLAEPLKVLILQTMTINWPSTPFFVVGIGAFFLTAILGVFTDNKSFLRLMISIGAIIIILGAVPEIYRAIYPPGG